MVISPQEANYKAKSKENIKSLEQRIDKALIDSLKNKESMNFSADLFPDEITRKTIIDKYRDAGWNVKYITDQRDGNYLEFSIKDKTGQYGSEKITEKIRPHYLR